VLADGRVLRIAGIEPISLLLADSEAADTALRDRLTSIVAGATITVSSISPGPDRYGRIPALVAVNGVLLQQILAREGLAIAFASGDPLPCFDKILEAENDARRAAAGYWSDRSLPWARPEALERRIGGFAIVEGVVLSVGNRRARTYLNFGRRWSEDVTAEIDAEHRDSFGGEEALVRLAGARVRIRGYVEESGGPMIAIRSPMQLEIVRAAAGNIAEAPVGANPDTP
jgi:hypothetical protein